MWLNTIKWNSYAHPGHCIQDGRATCWLPQTGAYSICRKTLINIFTSKFGVLHILKEKYPSHLAVKCTTVFIHVKNETNNQSAWNLYSNWKRQMAIPVVILLMPKNRILFLQCHVSEWRVICCTKPHAHWLRTCYSQTNECDAVTYVPLYCV